MARKPCNYLFKKAGKRNNPSSLLTNQKSVTNQQDMAEHFNNFFSSIGKNLHKNHSSGKERLCAISKNPKQK